jgi:hypothetical protein
LGSCGAPCTAPIVCTHSTRRVVSPVLGFDGESHGLTTNKLPPRRSRRLRVCGIQFSNSAVSARRLRDACCARDHEGRWMGIASTSRGPLAACRSAASMFPGLWGSYLRLRRNGHGGHGSPGARPRGLVIDSPNWLFLSTRQCGRTGWREDLRLGSDRAALCVPFGYFRAPLTVDLPNSSWWMQGVLRSLAEVGATGEFVLGFPSWSREPPRVSISVSADSYACWPGVLGVLTIEPLS